MGRRLGAIALIAVVFVATAAPANAQPVSSHIVIVSLDGTGPADWDRPNLVALGRLRGTGAVGLLSARSAATPPRKRIECGEFVSAHATLTEGRRVLRRPDRSEVPIAILEPPLIASAPSPGGIRTDYRSFSPIVLNALEGETILFLPLQDPLRADCSLTGLERDARVNAAMYRADLFLTGLRRKLGPTDRLVVLSSAAPIDRQLGRNFLTPVVIWDRSAQPSLLESETTRRPGVIALTDIAPSAMGWIGEPVPPSMMGHAVTADPRDDGPAEADRLDRRYAHAAAMRRVGGGPAGVAAALAIIAAALVLSGRGRARGGRVPRGVRDLVALGFVVVLATPATMLIEPAVRGGAGFVWWTAVGIGLVATIVFGARRALWVVAGATAVLILADLATGARLAAASGISSTIAEGDRFFGIGNELMGAVIASTLMAGGALLDDARNPPTELAMAVAMLIAVALMGAPAAGARFGSAVIAAPAFGILAVRGLGHRFDRIAAVGVAAATTLVTGLAVAAELIRTHSIHVPAAHLTETFAGSSFGESPPSTAWVGAAALLALSAGFVFTRRRALAYRAMWGLPHLRAALKGCAAAAVLAFLLNAHEAAGLLCTIGAAGFFHSFLAQKVP